MARYGDLDLLLENLKRQYGEELGWQCTVNMSDVGMMIDDAPTADVAPKSEIAREIETFEKKVGQIYDHYVFEDTDYSDDDVAIEAAMNALTEVLNELDELKKKYTKGE